MRTLIFLMLGLLNLSIAQTLNIETENKHLLQVGMTKDDAIARALFEKICLGFEALHPKNICKEQYFLNTEELADTLKKQQIDLAVLPEEMNLRPSFLPVLPLYQKSFTLIVHFNSDVHRLSDLQQKKIGFLKSSPEIDLENGRLTSDTVNNDDSATVQFLSKLGFSEQKNWSFYSSTQVLISAFCDHKIDAVIMNATHPNRAIRELTTACDGTILPISSQHIDAIVNNSPIYGLYEIQPAYWRMTQPIPTVSTRSILVAHSALETEILEETMAGFWNEIKDSKDFPLIINSIFQSFNQGKINLEKSGLGIISKIRAIKGEYQIRKIN